MPNIKTTKRKVAFEPEPFLSDEEFDDIPPAPRLSLSKKRKWLQSYSTSSSNPDVTSDKENRGVQQQTIPRLILTKKNNSTSILSEKNNEGNLELPPIMNLPQKKKSSSTMVSTTTEEGKRERKKRPMPKSDSTLTTSDEGPSRPKQKRKLQSTTSATTSSSSSSSTSTFNNGFNESSDEGEYLSFDTPKPKTVEILHNDHRIKLVRKFARHAKIGKIDVATFKPMDKNDRSKTFLKYDVTNDGNSLYRSISYLLFENEGYFNFIRGEVVKTMLKNKGRMDKICLKNTHGKYASIESYIRETNADKFGRMLNAFIEIHGVAIHFNTPVYLFTKPITFPPTEFLPTDRKTTSKSKSKQDTGCFVLHSLGKYIRPVLQFDGESFKHEDSSQNDNMISIQTGRGVNVRLPFKIDNLNAVSTQLCKEAVAKHPMTVNLGIRSLRYLERFSKGYYDEVDLDADLFNFASHYKAFTLMELMVEKFKQRDNVCQLASFLDRLRDETGQFGSELIKHFEDVCHQSVDQELKSLPLKSEKLKDVVRRVLRYKSECKVATKDLVVKLVSDNQFAFKDVFPFVVLYMNTEEKVVKYFSGPKPGGQKWIDVALNRRLLEEMKNIDSKHVVFRDNSVYFYCGTNGEGGRPRIGHINNVFDHTNHLNYFDLPKPKKPLESVELIVTDKNMACLVDVESKQVCDLYAKKWLGVKGFMPIEETDFYKEYIVSESGDNKQRVILREPGCEKICMFGRALEKVKFIYSIDSQLEALEVRKRLAEDDIYFDETDNTRKLREGCKMAYNSDLFAHYAIPPARDSYSPCCVYAIMDIGHFNREIRKLQTSSTFNCLQLIDFVVSNVKATDMPRLCKQLEIPYDTILAPNENDSIDATRLLFEDWYVLVRKFGKGSDVPLKMLAMATHHAGMSDLFKVLVPEEKFRRILMESEFYWSRINDMVKSHYDKMAKERQ